MTKPTCDSCFYPSEKLHAKEGYEFCPFCASTDASAMVIAPKEWERAARQVAPIVCHAANLLRADMINMLTQLGNRLLRRQDDNTDFTIKETTAAVLRELRGEKP